MARKRVSYPFVPPERKVSVLPKDFDDIAGTEIELIDLVKRGHVIGDDTGGRNYGEHAS